MRGPSTSWPEPVAYADVIGDGAALPPLLSARRRRWLLALMANGLARALLAAGALVGLRLAMAEPGPALPLPVLIGAMVLGFAAAAWLMRRETLDAEALAQHYIAHVRLRLFDRLATFTPAQIQRRSRGGVLMRFVGDVQALRGWVGRGIARGIVAGAMLAMLWPMLAWLAPALAAVAAGVLGLGALALWRLRSPLFEAASRARRRQATVAAFMQDRIAGLSVLQAAGQAGPERERLSRLNRRLRRALQQRAGWRGWHRAVASLANGGLLVALAWHGSIRVDVAGLGSLLGGALVVLLMLPAVRTLARAAEAWVEADVARTRVAEFLNGGMSSAEAEVRPFPGGAGGDLAAAPTLELRSPSWFGRVIGPDASIGFGRRIALCGGGGSGKSSLLLLLAGHQAPDAGEVLLHGLRLDALAASSRRRLVALLSPDMPLLRGTVAENVCYQAHSPSAQALDDALRLSGLQPLLADLPEGLDTRVRDGGLNLSHSLRRAVLLARCLAAQPALLLIDDPAACLPGDVEHRMRQLLGEFAGTVIFATQNPVLAALADEIWTFEDGRRVGSRPVLRPVPSEPSVNTLRRS